MTSKTNRNQPKEVALPNGRPKRPLSGYNIFFRFARQHMVNLYPRRQDAITSTFQDILKIDKDFLRRKVVEIINEYRAEESNADTKKARSKSHGIIGFLELSNAVAKQWKILDRSVKSIFDSASKEDKKVYIIHRNAWMSEKDERIKRKLQEQLLSEQVVSSQSNFPEDNIPSFPSMLASNSLPNPTCMQPFYVSSENHLHKHDYSNIHANNNPITPFNHESSCHQMFQPIVPVRQVTPDLNNHISWSQSLDSQDDGVQCFSSTNFSQTNGNSLARILQHPAGFSDKDHHNQVLDQNLPRLITSKDYHCVTKPYGDIQNTNALSDDIFGSEQELDHLLGLLE